MSGWDSFNPEYGDSIFASLAFLAWHHRETGIDIYAVGGRYEADLVSLFATCPIEHEQERESGIYFDFLTHYYDEMISGEHDILRTTKMIYTPVGDTIRRSDYTDYPLLRGVWIKPMLEPSCWHEGPIRLAWKPPYKFVPVKHNRLVKEGIHLGEGHPPELERNYQAREILCLGPELKKARAFYTAVTFLNRRRPAPPLGLIHIPFYGDDARRLGDCIAEALCTTLPDDDARRFEARFPRTVFLYAVNGEWRRIEATSTQELFRHSHAQTDDAILPPEE